MQSAVAPGGLITLKTRQRKGADGQTVNEPAEPGAESSTMETSDNVRTAGESHGGRAPSRPMLETRQVEASSNVPLADHWYAHDKNCQLNIHGLMSLRVHRRAHGPSHLVLRDTVVCDVPREPLNNTKDERLAEPVEHRECISHGPNGLHRCIDV